ncbi:hypothetical protein CYMTET_39012 [Cymbomonas tetramitiformis]|uniref:4a-hydroxytetrahydrobiopterin dehydratase n=1 Tax=Cymbomonas tetramitiformis TaxID=36881 RepID=A0AAE0CCZ5_9CHLO|nr:hypothetical protein CYMTET_39012 [Cymbomonas tetramitiformis]
MAKCCADTPLLTDAQIDESLGKLTAWNLSEDRKLISRAFVAKNFVSAMNFLNSAAEVAEAEGHHPDFHLTNYREVKIDVTTHAIGGLAEIDMELAAKLDAIKVDYSPKSNN